MDKSTSHSTKSCKRFPLLCKVNQLSTYAAADSVLTESAVFSMFSAKIAKPFVGSLTNTWVTAPTNFPSCKMGEPLMTVSR